MIVLNAWTRRSRRAVVAGGGLAGALGVVAACAAPGQGAGGGSAQGGQVKTPVSLTWLARTDMGPVMSDWHQKSAAAFAAQEPNVTIDMGAATSGDYNTKATAMFAGGTPPDVMGNYAGGFGTFVVNGWLDDLLPYANRDKFDLKSFETSALEAVRREGKLLGLPVGHNPWVLFVNHSLLQERGVALPPTDWKDRRWNLETLVKVAQQLITRGDASTATWGVLHPEGQMETQAIWLWGADPLNPQGGPEKSSAYQTGTITQVHYTQPKVVEAVQANVDLMHRHRVAPTPAEQRDFAAGWATPLHTGRLGFWAAGAWSLRNFKESAVPFKWGLAPLAHGLGATAANTAGLFNDAFHVVKGTKAAEAAYRLVAFLATGERAQGYTEGAGTFPANRALYDGWYDETLKTPGMAPSRAELRSVMEGAMATGFASPGKTLHRQRDIQSAFAQAFAPIRNAEQPASIGLREVQTQIEAVSREG